LLQATEESINTAYIDLAASMDGGVQRVIDTAVDLGIPAKAPGLDPNLSTVLGSATISPIDMANAFGSIAAGGRAKEWYLIDAVESPDGAVQFKHRVRTTEAVSEDVAADTSYALQQVAAAGTGINARLADRPVAGKTGTATSEAGHVRSSWFVGYTPQLSTAVMYVRGNGNEPLDGFLDTFFGGQHPALTWRAIMSRALAGTEVIQFPPPANLEQTAEGHEAPTQAPAPSTPPPEPSPTQTRTPTPSETPTPSPTRTPSPTPSPTQTPSPTETPSPTPSQTPTASPTRSPSPTASPTGRGGGGGSPAGGNGNGGDGSGAGGTGVGGDGGGPGGG
jgi:membrane peptidoglycan carboxypeptidase